MLIIIDHSLMVDRKEVSNGEYIPPDVSASAGSALKHDSKATIIKDLPIMCSQSGATKGYQLDASNDGQEAVNFRSRPPICDEFQRESNEDAEDQLVAVHVKTFGRHFLDLSVAPSGI